MALECSATSDTDKKLDTAKNVHFRIARPLFGVMLAFGLLHRRFKNRAFTILSKLYSSFVLCVMWAMFLRLFCMYTEKSTLKDTAIKLIIHAWCFLCATAGTSTVRACTPENVVLSSFNQWSRSSVNIAGLSATNDKQEKRYIRTLKIQFYINFILGLLTFITACCLLGYIQLHLRLTDFQLLPMQPGHRFDIVLRCFHYMCYVYMAASWTFSLCFFSHIARSLSHEFRTLTNDLRNAIHHDDGHITNLECFRQRHMNICLQVEIADGVMCGFNAVSFLVNLVIGMLGLFSLVRFSPEETNLVFFANHIFWLIICFLNLAVISVGFGFLNHLAHSPLKILHFICLSKTSPEQPNGLEMMMFLNKLTAEPIGVTAMGMFVIDKPTILTVCGAFLTYFIVLLQFQTPDGNVVDIPLCANISMM